MSSLAKGPERSHQCRGTESKSAGKQLSRNSANLKLVLTQRKSSLVQKDLLHFGHPIRAMLGSTGCCFKQDHEELNWKRHCQAKLG